VVEGRPPDTDLVRRAQLGDDDAIRGIVTTYQDIAFRTAYLITRSEEDARDAAQDGFIKALAALGRFDPTKPLRPWLLTIVSNEARNRVRSGRRREQLVLRITTEVTGDAAPSPEASAVAVDTRERLLARINVLPDDQRAVVALRYFAGLSEQETAAALGVRVGTIKSRHSRALARLRELIGDVDA
jgi:RNA polymerase sigma-70 factor (ECF subfamily)